MDRVRLFSTKKLYSEHEERFFQQVEEGKVYLYAWEQYLFSDVTRAAQKYGVDIKYARGYTFKVLSTSNPAIEPVSKEPVIFDPAELVI